MRTEGDAGGQVGAIGDGWRGYYVPSVLVSGRGPVAFGWFFLGRLRYEFLGGAWVVLVVLKHVLPGVNAEATYFDVAWS